MTTPTLGAPATAAPAAKADPAAALWRALCALATVVDPRLTPDHVRDDPGSVANLAHLYGGDPADIAVIADYVASTKE
jgi:hypothetical protein